MTTGGALVAIVALSVALLGWFVALYEKRRIVRYKAKRDAAAGVSAE